MATSVLPFPSLAVSWGPLDPLPFSLDLTCPISLPARISIGTHWPFPIAGPSTITTETIDKFIRRRYLETVYLSDTISPIPHLFLDILRLQSTSIVDLIQPVLIPLPQIEVRHRKTLLPIISALISASSNPSTEVYSGILLESIATAGLDEDEVEVIKVAVELRLESRYVSDGGTVVARKVSEELEKREVLVQIALLFLYIGRIPPESIKPPKKRRKEHKRRGSSTAKAVSDDPAASLELLMDRLSVWSAVAELGIGLDDLQKDPKAKEKESGTQAMLRVFWEEVVVQFFLPTQSDLCETFHLKVFGKSIPPKLLPPPTTKKSRKPKITRARPSSDSLTQHEPLLRPVSRAPSRAPSDTGSRASPPLRDRSFSRTISRASESLPEFTRSRSRSVDPDRIPASSLVPPKKGLVRAPSGKDLFKSRQVGFIRRTSSIIVQKGKERDVGSQQSLGLGRTESQSRGLLGRKTSDPTKSRRDSTEGQSQSQPGTLIFATPSKPRLANSLFGPRIGINQFIAPTPIQEEPRSNDRPSFITETPVGPGRIAHSMPEGVGETLMGISRNLGEVMAGTGSSNTLKGMSSMDPVVDSEDSDDPLGDLMVMTDEDGDEGGMSIPETPAR